jgi:ferric-dicitrate binding protein FerR (iron transport regulator)
MDEQVDDLLSQGRDEEVKAMINAMLQQPAQTPMPPEVAAGVLEAIVSSDGADNTPVVDIKRKRTWRLFAACAAFILALGAGYCWLHIPGIANKENNQEPERKPVAAILPGGNKAVLTLADGRRFVLDSSTAGGLALQGNTKILIQDEGTLAYHSSKQMAGNGPVLYNTVSTPNGGQYRIILPDGTRVWLNAASSIRFPTSFAGERKITMTGEVYFEVAHDKKHPFRVSAPDLFVEVLGTHFNIKAYANDVAKTSLLTGSLKANDKLLKPGQAYANGDVVETNTDQDVAWKNGLFNLSGADFKDFMRQVERWYDVTVQYEGAVPNIEFQGKLNRAVPLSDNIDYLKNLGVACYLEGKTLFVKVNKQPK